MLNRVQVFLTYRRQRHLEKLKNVCPFSLVLQECPELPDPPHGDVHLTGRHFNDRAVYTCDDGYQIVGLDQVLCNSNGQWSGEQPTCKQSAYNSQSRFYCGEPTTIPHAKHNGSKEQVNLALRNFYPLHSL